MTAQTFENFITDERSAEVVRVLRQLCADPASVPSPVVLWGRSGVGKTHLCRAVKAAADGVTFCSADDIISAVIYSLRSAGTAEGFFGAFEGRNLIVDDADMAVFRGQAMQDLLAELIVRQKNNGNFVLMTFNRSYPSFRWYTEDLQAALRSGSAYRIEPPDRETLLRHCRDSLRANGITLNDRQAALVVDLWGDTVPKLEATVRTFALRTRFLEENKDQ